MTQEVKQRRVPCNYQTENARFLLDCDFSKQYDRYYKKRLEKTRPYLEYNCRSKWDPNIPIFNLSEVANFVSTSELLADSEASSPSLSLPESSNELFCNYKFKKRPRKLSASDVATPKQPQTSTQNNRGQEEGEEPMFSDDELKFASPVVGGQRVEISPSVRKPSGSKSARCIVIGTIFKRMKLQPDVVQEISKGDFNVKCEKYLGHYTSQDDTLVLEDHEESIQLVGNIRAKSFVTGINVALLGVPIDDGSQFMVMDICFPEPNRELLYDNAQLQAATTSGPERPLATQSPCYLMIVSDLGFHYEMDQKLDHTRALQDMIDFIWGGANFSDDQRSSRVARILVAGNSLHEDRFLENEDEEDELVAQAMGRGQDEIMFKMKQSRQVKQYTKTIQAVKHMDDFFAQLSKTIHVDVMPGPSDPSSHLMPQQPFHPCMFPQSCMFKTFNCSTNPHHAVFNDTVEILTTAGQNIDIIGKFSGLRDPIEIMKCQLMWGNSAPSAPDNLYSVPYEADDPFVIDFIPDVYVAGCQEEYKTDYYQYTSSDSQLDTVSQKSAESSFQAGLPVPQTTPGSSKKSDWERNVIASQNCGTPDIGGKFDDSDGGSQRSAGAPPIGGSREPNNNAPAAQKRATLLISVPKFSKTFNCVLLDLVTLESQLISFGK